jgi:DNA-binding XRE family transcriptional regulator
LRNLDIMSQSPLRKWRTTKKLTLAEAAEKVGISMWAYQRIETQTTQDVSLTVALRIAAVSKGRVKPKDLLPTKAA